MSKWIICIPTIYQIDSLTQILDQYKVKLTKKKYSKLLKKFPYKYGLSSKFLRGSYINFFRFKSKLNQKSRTKHKIKEFKLKFKKFKKWSKSSWRDVIWEFHKIKLWLQILSWKGFKIYLIKKCKSWSKQE